MSSLIFLHILVEALEVIFGAFLFALSYELVNKLLSDVGASNFKFQNSVGKRISLKDGDSVGDTLS